MKATQCIEYFILNDKRSRNVVKKYLSQYSLVSSLGYPGSLTLYCSSLFYSIIRAAMPTPFHPKLVVIPFLNFTGSIWSFFYKLRQCLEQTVTRSEGLMPSDSLIKISIFNLSERSECGAFFGNVSWKVDQWIGGYDPVFLENLFTGLSFD